MKRRGTAYVLDVVGALVVLITIFPFLWLAMTSVKLKKDQLTWPPVLIPHHISFEHYRTIFSDLSMLGGLSNTVIIAVCSTILSVLIGT